MFRQERSRKCSFLFSFLLLFPAFVATGQEAADSLRAKVDLAVSKVKPSLVRIEVVWPDYYEGREVKYEASGSGAIISPEGHVVTNHHVAGKATRIVCTLSDKEEIEADLVGKDPLTDIAVLKLRPEKPRKFPVAHFGDSDAVRVGDHILAMGSPMALSQSVTLGIVSNTEMVMPRWLGPYRRVDEEGEDVGSFVRWIGHDAAIYGGNSGGPLVNLQGEIIGINEIRMALSGAIPGNVAQKVVKDLVSHGRVRRSWLGIQVQPRLKHTNGDKGVLIGSVLKGGPAEKGGMKAGDVLLRLGDHRVDVAFDEQIPLFNHLVADLPIGEEVKVVVQRDGKEVPLTLTTADREEALPPEHELKQWGLTVQNLSFLLAKELKRDTRNGVLVTSVRPGGSAGEAKPALTEKDIITAINDTPVTCVKDMQRETKKVMKGQTERPTVVVQFDRRAQKLLTVIEVGLKELDDPGRETKKAWLPVETQVITRDLAKALGKPDMNGFRVTRVYEGTTAQKAGLQVGDLILAVDGEPLDAAEPEDYEELPVLIRQYKIGSETELKVFRGEEEKRITVELAQAPKQRREMKKYRDDNFEFTVRDINFMDKATEEWKKEQAGVLVEEVKSGGWAALGQLGVNDLILAVDGAPIATVEDFEGHMKAVEDKKAPAVVFKVLRGIYTCFIELEPQW